MITIHAITGFDKRLFPIPAQKHKAWWQDNDRTRNHIHHCLPLTMANSLGHYILSPATFTVEWDGDVQREAAIVTLDDVVPGTISAHAAYGSFTIQPGFIPTTDKVGDFIYIKGLPNERGLPYDAMEGVIEGWWNSAQFGLVFLLNQPGKFLITAGQPIAHMFVLAGGSASASVEVTDQMPMEHAAWRARRHRSGYTKDKDYLQGRHPDGNQEQTHATNWEEAAAKFK